MIIHESPFMNDHSQKPETPMSPQPNPAIPTPPTRPDPREAILAAASALLGERGYHGTTMQGIAEQAGCSVGYLYKHFPGKLDLARELIDRGIEQLERSEAQVRAQGLPPLVAYRLLLDSFCRFVADRWPLVRVYATSTVLRRLPAARERSRWVRRRDRELIAQACACGDLPAIDADLLAAALQGVQEGLLDRLTESHDPTAVRQVPDLVFQLVIEPLRARASATRTSKEAHHDTDR